jgi:hypothetical protein
MQEQVQQQKQIPFGNDNKKSERKQEQKQVLPLRGRMTTKKTTVDEKEKATVAVEQKKREEIPGIWRRQT